MDSRWQHTTVLLNEAVEALVTKPDGTYVDATFGRGGHSRLILSRLEPRGRLVAFDKDPEAVAVANAIADTRFRIRHEGFAALRCRPDRDMEVLADALLPDVFVERPRPESRLVLSLVVTPAGVDQARLIHPFINPLSTSRSATSKPAPFDRVNTASIARSAIGRWYPRFTSADSRSSRN